MQFVPADLCYLFRLYNMSHMLAKLFLNCRQLQMQLLQKLASNQLTLLQLRFFNHRMLKMHFCNGLHFLQDRLGLEWLYLRSMRQWMSYLRYNYDHLL